MLSSSAVSGNLILQDATQTSVQDQLDLGGYGYSAPDAQLSVQGNVNEAAAVGNYNVIGQDATQTSVQTQTDIGQYLPSGYGY